jgi:hypothetical protein
LDPTESATKSIFAIVFCCGESQCAELLLCYLSVSGLRASIGPVVSRTLHLSAQCTYNKLCITVRDIRGRSTPNSWLLSTAPTVRYGDPVPPTNPPRTASGGNVPPEQQTNTLFVISSLQSPCSFDNPFFLLFTALECRTSLPGLLVRRVIQASRGRGGSLPGLH